MGCGATLAATLRGRESVAIVCHDDPDPDCLASGYALQAIAAACGVSRADLYAGGHLSHPQNRALARALGLDLRSLSDPRLDRADAVAFVDHAIPGLHTEFSPDRPVDIVIDHHDYPSAPTGPFVDLRPEYGATATIMVEYLRELGYRPHPALASALLFALHRERLDHVRRPTDHEYEAARWLFPQADTAFIGWLYSTAMTPTTMDAIAAAIRNRRVTGTRLASWVGRLPERDALPQAADYLLNLKDVHTTLVVGLVEDTLHLSARSVDPTVNLGWTLRHLVREEGQAGGHRDMAGGVVWLDPWLTRPDQESALVARVIEPLFENFYSLVARSGDRGRTVESPRDRPPVSTAAGPTGDWTESVPTD